MTYRIRIRHRFIMTSVALTAMVLALGWGGIWAVDRLNHAVIDLAGRDLAAMRLTNQIVGDGPILAGLILQLSQATSQGERQTITDRIGARGQALTEANARLGSLLSEPGTVAELEAADRQLLATARTLDSLVAQHIQLNDQDLRLGDALRDLVGRETDDKDIARAAALAPLYAAVIDATVAATPGRLVTAGQRLQSALDACGPPSFHPLAAQIGDLALRPDGLLATRGQLLDLEQRLNQLARSAQQQGARFTGLITAFAATGEQRLQAAHAQAQQDGTLLSWMLAVALLTAIATLVLLQYRLDRVVIGRLSRLRRLMVAWVPGTAPVVTPDGSDEITEMQTALNGLFVSITSHAQALQVSEKLAAEHSALLRAVNQISVDAIVTADDSGVVTTANAAAAALFGRAAAELIGTGFADLTPRALGRWLGRHLPDLLSGPDRSVALTERWSALKVCDGVGGYRPVAATLSKTTINGRGVVTVSLRDMTAVAQTQTELRDAKLAAEAGNTAKSQFLANISHELRTPLNAILGFTQLLGRNLAVQETPPLRDSVNQIRRGGTLLLRLITDLLDFAKIEAGQVTLQDEIFEAASVLEEIDSALEQMADQHQVSLTIGRPDPDLPPVHADRTRVVQILLNLTTNAIKYNRPGGSVTVQASHHGAWVELTVEDTGIGIPASRQDEMFQPFNRLDAAGGSIEGTGIGLTIARRLARSMGGNIHFTSQEGIGSRFILDLPAGARRAVPVPVAAQDPLAPITALPVSVLYIEDNPINLMLVESFIQTIPGCQFIAAADARTGIELARSRRPALILMDIQMPDMDGYEALAHLRTLPETVAIPVIACTAAARPADIERGFAAGFTDYLVKPFELEHLIRLIRRYTVPAPQPSL